MAIRDFQTMRLQGPFSSSSTASSTQARVLRIPSKCLAEMAQAVVDSGKTSLQIPASIAAIARRAVKIRRSFSMEVQKQGLLGLDKESDDRHTHFVGILEGSLNALVAKASVPPTVSNHGSVTSEAIAASLSNNFQALDIEEVYEDGTPERPSTTSTKGTERKPPETIEIMDDCEQQIDRLVMLQDFLKELHELLGYLCNLWQDYHDSKMDLCTASTLSTAALVLAAEKEKHVAGSLEIPENDLWEKLKQNFPEAHRNGYAPAEGMNIQDFRNVLSTIEMTTWKFWAKFNPDMTSVYANGVRSLGLAKNIPTIRKMFPEIFEFDPQTCSFGFLWHKQRLEENDALLSQMFIDAIFTTTHVADTRERMAKDKLHESQEDQEFTEKYIFPYYRRASGFDGLTWQLTKSYIEPPTICSLFTGCLILRLKDILSSRPTKVLDELRQYETKITATFGTQNPAKWRGNFPRFEAVDRMALLQPKLLVPASQEPVAPYLKKQHADRGGVEQVLDDGGDGIVVPSLDPDFLYKHNPILCGTRLMNLKHAVEHGSITVANSHVSVLQAATIINVLRQTGRIKLNWPLLDRAMELQTNNLFFGALPTTPKRAHQVFMLRYGQTLANYNNISRKPLEGISLLCPGFDYTGKVWPDCLRPTKASEVFTNLYETEETMLRIIYALKKEAEKTRKEVTRQPKSNEGYTAGVSIVPFLETLRPFLIQSNEEASFDWLTLTEECNKLLQYLVDTKLFVSEQWKKGASKATRRELERKDLEKKREGALSPTMQNVVDFWNQPAALCGDLAVIQHCREEGRPLSTVKDSETRCARFAKEVEKWVAKNIK